MRNLWDYRNQNHDLQIQLTNRQIYPSSMYLLNWTNSTQFLWSFVPSHYHPAIFSSELIKKSYYTFILYMLTFNTRSNSWEKVEQFKMGEKIEKENLIHMSDINTYLNIWDMNMTINLRMQSTWSVKKVELLKDTAMFCLHVKMGETVNLLPIV